MSEDCRKLVVHFGERARADGAFLADALIDVFARRELRTSLVLRGAAGFGAKHQSTDRLLSMSEDLPLVAIAVDRPDRIAAALADVRALPRFSGLATLERARMLTGAGATEPPGGATKLTVHLGRHERIGGRAAHEAVVALLHERGIAGATVLLGVDGTIGGRRQRARFLGRNVEVPLMIIAVGDGGPIATVLPELAALLPHAVVTLEAVEIDKRDGRRLAAPEADPGAGPDVRQKMMVFASEQSRHGGRPLQGELLRALRAGGAAGATSLRGVWGYHGDHAPHGDRMLQLRRRVPVVTTIVDTPAGIQRAFAIVDELTDETGLVTCETCSVVDLAG